MATRMVRGTLTKVCWLPHGRQERSACAIVVVEKVVTWIMVRTSSGCCCGI